MEFHLSAAKARGCDVVVTVGGLQSNHCRTTAVACRLVGMETHLLLATEVIVYVLPFKNLSLSPSFCDIHYYGTLITVQCMHFFENEYMTLTLFIV